MEQLNITEKKGSDYMLLEVQGTINSYTFDDFQTKVYSFIDKTNLCVDLAKVTNLSSAGLGVLMTAHEDSIEKGHKLFILKPSEVVKLALQSTGFLSTFNIISTVSEIA
jgi:anti-anti-sigma factor